jgi:hypothetical protein
MNINFPVILNEFSLSTVDLEKIYNPLFACSIMQIKENDFYFNVAGVASYRAKNGNEVQIYPHKKADLASIKLFLNGSVLGAILHQRATLPFHGSCFELDRKGILLCGDSGAGKSSVTAAFCQDGAIFINDDITPVEITESATTIIPIKTRIKLWDDSIKKLEIENTEFEKIRPSLDKFYLPVKKNYQKQQRLHQIFILGIHDNDNFDAIELKGMEKFNVLREQIYRQVYLKGMPATEKTYFKQLFLLAKTVKVTRILRPQEVAIADTRTFIKQQLV